MSHLVTRSTIRDTIRQRCDMVGSTFIPDATLNQWIDDSTRELYDMLVDARGEEYYTKSSPINTVNGTATYAITNYLDDGDSFYKLRGLYLLVGSGSTAKRLPLTKKTLAELLVDDVTLRNPAGWSASYGDPGIWYTWYQETLRFSPIPNRTATVEMWYIPTFDGFTGDGISFDAINGWHTYVVADCCIKALATEEADTSVFQAEKQALAARIATMKANRDQGQVVQVRDTARGWY